MTIHVKVIKTGESVVLHSNEAYYAHLKELENKGYDLTTDILINQTD